MNTPPAIDGGLDTAWNGCPLMSTNLVPVGNDRGQVVFPLFELAADPPLMIAAKKARAESG